MNIRAAVSAEAPALTALAMRSKRHWGYDDAFMAAAVQEMTVSPELIDRSATFVAERDGRPLGFYVLSVEGGEPTLRDLWIEPGEMRSGIGKVLWVHMLDEARARRFRTVRLVSEPNATGFYARMGARQVGSVASTVVAGRMLPVFVIDVV